MALSLAKVLVFKAVAASYAGAGARPSSPPPRLHIVPVPAGDRGPAPLSARTAASPAACSGPPPAGVASRGGRRRRKGRRAAAVRCLVMGKGGGGRRGAAQLAPAAPGLPVQGLGLLFKPPEAFLPEPA